MALIDGEDTTIKRFYREENKICLQPENDDFAPMYFSDVQILGKVVGSIRRF